MKALNFNELPQAKPNDFDGYNFAQYVTEHHSDKKNELIDYLKQSMGWDWYIQAENLLTSQCKLDIRKSNMASRYDIFLTDDTTTGDLWVTVTDCDHSFDNPVLAIRTSDLTVNELQWLTTIGLH